MTKIGTGKSIILIMPNYAGLDKFIKKNLEFHGFDVVYREIQPYQYQSFSEKITNFFGAVLD